MISKTITFEDIEREITKLFKGKGRPFVISFDIRFLEQFDKLIKDDINNYAKAKTFR